MTDETLDTLAARSRPALAALYAGAAPPRSLASLDGPLRGRMLAVRDLRGPIAAFLRRIARSQSFLWEGKTFRSTSDDAGAGINRVYAPGVLGRQQLFPFHTRPGPSVLDGRPAVVLDYDLAENPVWIRHIHDEVREVVPGLFLGPAMWRAAAGHIGVLWFALDARSE